MRELLMIDLCLFELILDSVLLKEKGLIDQANKILDQAKESVILEEDVFLHLKIKKLQRENNIRKSSIDLLEFNCSELYPQMLELTDGVIENIEINQLRNKIYILYLKYGYGVTEAAVRSEVQEILQNPLLNDERNFSSSEMSYMTFGIKAVGYGMLGDQPAAVKVIKMRIAAFENHPLFHTEQVKRRYGFLLCDLLIDFFFPDIDDKEIIFRKIQGLKPGTLEEEIHLFHYSYSNMMTAYINLPSPAKGVALIPEAEIKIKRYKDKIPEEALLLLQWNISTLYFMANNNVNALKWMNKTLEHSNKEIRKDTYADIRILNILIHYEQGNFQLIESLLVSLERFLIRKKSMDPVSKAMIYHLRKLNFIRDKKEINSELLLLRSELNLIIENQKDKKPFILGWIERKLQKK